MVITYHGGEFFKATFGDVTVAINPISKESKLKPSRFGVDIAIVSLNDKDFNGIEQVTHADKKPFVINGDDYSTKDGTPARDYTNVVNTVEKNYVPLLNKNKNRDMHQYKYMVHTFLPTRL